MCVLFVRGVVAKKIGARIKMKLREKLSNSPYARLQQIAAMKINEISIFFMFST